MFRLQNPLFLLVLSLDSSGTLSSAIDAGDVVINGQFHAFATTDDVEAIVSNINTNVDNVTATAFNVVVAKGIGDGVTGGTASDGLTLKTRGNGCLCRYNVHYFSIFIDD